MFEVPVYAVVLEGVLTTFQYCACRVILNCFESTASVQYNVEAFVDVLCVTENTEFLSMPKAPESVPAKTRTNVIASNNAPAVSFM